jgi:hypothetical protein
VLELRGKSQTCGGREGRRTTSSSFELIFEIFLSSLVVPF